VVPDLLGHLSQDVLGQLNVLRGEGELLIHGLGRGLLKAHKRRVEGPTVRWHGGQTCLA